MFVFITKFVSQENIELFSLKFLFRPNNSKNVIIVVPREISCGEGT